MHVAFVKDAFDQRERALNQVEFQDLAEAEAAAKLAGCYVEERHSLTFPVPSGPPIYKFKCFRLTQYPF